MRDFSNYNGIQELTQQNQLIGMNDVVPGLIGDLISKPRSHPGAPLSTDKLKIMPYQTIYLHNLNLACSASFEKAFENFLFYSCLKQNGATEGSHEANLLKAQIKIKERKLHVSVNNGWSELLQ